MWWRSRHLWWAALFTWAMILGFRSGSWRFVLWPFIAIGSWFLLSEYLVKKFPEFGKQLAAGMLLPLMLFNLTFSFWPAFRGRFPFLAEAIERSFREKELNLVKQLDPCLVEARRQLESYQNKKENSAAARIQAELEDLGERAKNGTFSDNDRQRERELIAQLLDLAQTREEFDAIIKGCQGQTQALAKIRPNRIRIDDPSKFEFFDTVTGQPKVWYYRSSEGLFEFFDKAGKHPTTGSSLQPITQQAVMEFTLQRSADASRERQQTEAATRFENQRQRTAFLDHYLNVGIARPVGTKEAAVLVWEDADGPSTKLEIEIAALLASHGIQAAQSFFKPAFVQEGRARSLFNGEWAIFDQLELSRHVDYVLIGFAKVSYGSNPELAGVLTANLDLQIKCMATSSRSFCGSSTLSMLGAGYTQSAALENASERLQPQLESFVRGIK